MPMIKVITLVVEEAMLIIKALKALIVGSLSRIIR
jgi:hypothetical protein